MLCVDSFSSFTLELSYFSCCMIAGPAVSMTKKNQVFHNITEGAIHSLHVTRAISVLTFGSGSDLKWLIYFNFFLLIIHVPIQPTTLLLLQVNVYILKQYSKPLTS
ncbi:hypothetical protein RIF29_25954 [Crotalaria pallida]|uniref:Uncharacterized protein n=1 Tax=Crotalaria pallida TaxID=3830 RepID=A0AAN9EPE8_CROPI